MPTVLHRTVYCPQLDNCDFIFKAASEVIVSRSMAAYGLNDKSMEGRRTLVDGFMRLPVWIVCFLCWYGIYEDQSETSY